MAYLESILFIDAYDSFSQNIKALLHQEFAQKITTVQIDTDVEIKFGCSLQSFVNRFSAIVLGPGPGNPGNEPSDVGIFNDVLSHATAGGIPVLGICLGFQTICLRYGYTVQRLPEPCHGHAKKIIPLKCHPIFENIDQECIYATCYNSLGAYDSDGLREIDVSRPGSSSTNASFGSSSDSGKSVILSFDKSSELEIIATDEDGIIMAVAHKKLPQYGFQFHPESCKSNQSCQQMLTNWFSLVNLHNKSSGRKRCKTADQEISDAKLSHTFSHEVLGDATGGQCCKGKSNRQSLLGILVDATSSCTSRVSYRQEKTDLTRKEVSEAVMKLNNNSTTMMLESTRKGRFSIYALLADDSVCAKQSVQQSHKLSEVSLSSRQGKVSIYCSQHCAQGNEAVRRRDHPKIRDGTRSSFRLELDNEDLLGAIEDFMVQRHVTEGPIDLPFWGGFTGFVSYELGLDQLCTRSDQDQKRPVDDLNLVWVERSVVFDSWTSTVTVQSIIDNDEDFIERTFDYLNSAGHRPKLSELRHDNDTNACLQKILQSAKIDLPVQQEYNENYDQCQKQLRSGNSYELCLTTEASVTLPMLTKESLFALYQNMHAHNPVPYGAFLDLPNITILSTSPEEFMAWDRCGTIDMRPMKGTVKRTPDMTLAKAQEILSTPKETAENLMIADLIRHDLYSAVGYTSQVKVVKLCEVIEHETVYQLVSHIRASAPIPPSLPIPSQQKLAMHYGFKALTTSLPPGSMTGAPKKRSCEILRALEKRDRGLYSGVIGYLDVGGGGAWNVCIRTAFQVKDETETEIETENDTGTEFDHRPWRIGAGGAITVLSDRQAEWEEMQTKLNSVLKGFTTVKTG